MNAITPITSARLTMSSREIAELCEKEHGHVMRDTRTMLEQLGKDESSFGGIYQDAYDRDKPCYHLPKDLTITLITGYDVVRRHKVMVRWMQLEEQVTRPLHPIPQSLPEALRLAAQAIEQRDQLALENQAKAQALAIAAPKAIALDRISNADGSVCTTDAAKNLQVPPRVLFRWLQEHRWLYRRVGCPHYCGYQDKIQAGLVEQKVTVVRRTDGTEKSVEQVRITSRGLARLAQMPDLRGAA